MTDEGRRRQRSWVVVVTLAYALVAAEAVTAAWALVAGDRWDWGRFSVFFVAVVISAVVSSVAEAVARRTSPEAQRKAVEEDELAGVMRTGLFPPDPDWWRARIRRDIRSDVTVVALGAVLCVTAAALTSVAARLNNDDAPGLWALAVVALLLLVPLFWLLIRVRLRGQRVLARL